MKGTVRPGLRLTAFNPGRLTKGSKVVAVFAGTDIHGEQLVAGTMASK